jgi:hypothetical protein
MKRVRSIQREQDEAIQLCVVFPSELWPPILSYLSIVQRYQWLTVCKEWGEAYGLIDQSVTTLRYRYEGPLGALRSLQPSRLAGMLNIQSLDATLTGEISKQLAAHSMHLKVLRLANYGRLPSENTVYCGDSISKLTNLTSLDLARTAQLSMSDLIGLTSLTRLSLHKDARLGDSGLRAFTRLKSLSLNCSQVSDQGLIVLTIDK